MSSLFRGAFEGFGWELLDKIRQTTNERISDAEFEERIIGIKKATIAMIELDVTEEQIIRMLQKHWDLRLSEAKEFMDSFKQSN